MTELAFCDRTGAFVIFSWNETASGRFHIYLEMIPLGKNLHAKQVRPLSPGIEVKRLFRGIIRGIPGWKEAFKNPSLRFFNNAHTIVLNDQLCSLAVSPDKDFDLSFIRCVFHGVFNQAVDYFS